MRKTFSIITAAALALSASAVLACPAGTYPDAQGGCDPNPTPDTCYGSDLSIGLPDLYVRQCQGSGVRGDYIHLDRLLGAANAGAVVDLELDNGAYVAYSFVAGAGYVSIAANGGADPGVITLSTFPGTFVDPRVVCSTTSGFLTWSAQFGGACPLVWGQTYYVNITAMNPALTGFSSVSFKVWQSP